MKILQDLQQAVRIEQENRSRISKTQGWVKYKPEGNNLRILPLPAFISAEKDIKFAEVEREHWIRRKENGVESKTKYVCWGEVINDKWDYSSCPFCVGILEIKRYIETEKYNPEDYRMMEELIYRTSDKVSAKIDSSKTCWYMNAIDCDDPPGKNPQKWGCSPVTIQNGITNVLGFWKDLAHISRGNTIFVKRKDMSYTVTPLPPTPISDEYFENVRSKLKDFKEVHTHSITRQAAVEIVDSLIDLGDNWFQV